MNSWFKVFECTNKAFVSIFKDFEYRNIVFEPSILMGIPTTTFRCNDEYKRKQ